MFALRFIIDELRDDDRLSIMQFNGKRHGKQPALANLLWWPGMVDSLSPGGGTAFKPAL